MVLKLSLDNKMPASSDFTPRQRMSLLGLYLANRANGGLSLCLCCRFKSWTYAASVMLWGIVSVQNQSWDNNLGHFDLKIGIDLARAFLM
jgi:hypothetical protein